MGILGSAMSVSAANVTTPPYVTLSTSWKTIASSTSGFNCNIAVVSSVTGTDGIGAVRPDIRMLGRNDNVLWSEKNSCPGLGTRVYRCGPDVYKLQIRVSNGSGSARAYVTTDEPN